MAQKGKLVVTKHRDGSRTIQYRANFLGKLVLSKPLPYPTRPVSAGLDKVQRKMVLAPYLSAVAKVIDEVRADVRVKISRLSGATGIVDDKPRLNVLPDGGK